MLNVCRFIRFPSVIRQVLTWRRFAAEKLRRDVNLNVQQTFILSYMTSVIRLNDTDVLTYSIVIRFRSTCASCR